VYAGAPAATPLAAKAARKVMEEILFMTAEGLSESSVFLEDLPFLKVASVLQASKNEN